MKVLKYRLCTEINYGTEEHPNIQQFFSNVTLEWSEVNEEIAKTEAYNGDSEPEPTEQEQLRADVDFLLVMVSVL